MSTSGTRKSPQHEKVAAATGYLIAAANSAAQKAILQRQIDSIPLGGTKIDRLVYDLYPSADGTAEEIALVEGQG